jgi:mRNA-degrading endonuclease YafQ of YafQ-DinJ toxin-antitoxin module
MIIAEILKEYYSYDELTQVILTETNVTDNWDFQFTTAYKKGYKKHSNDKRVMNNLDILINHIKSFDKIPPITSYPAEYNVHQIKEDKRFSGMLWGHLKGQKIGLLFDIMQDPKTKKLTLKLVHLGTHQEIGWS